VREIKNRRVIWRSAREGEAEPLTAKRGRNGRPKTGERREKWEPNRQSLRKRDREPNRRSTREAEETEPVTPERERRMRGRLNREPLREKTGHRAGDHREVRRSRRRPRKESSRQPNQRPARGIATRSVPTEREKPEIELEISERSRNRVGNR
jgi:hypothetical protein